MSCTYVRDHGGLPEQRDPIEPDRMGMVEVARRLVRRREAPVEVRPESADEIVRWLHWIEPQPVRFLLPCSMLMMQGARAYDELHPFVRYVRGEMTALEGFYATFQPRNLAEMYGMDAESRGSDLPPWELPWLLRSKRTAPPGEAGLGPEHGVSFYGPASRRKIEAEARRLDSIAQSVKRRGYDWKLAGDIAGHFIRDGERIGFFVRGGKHRCAVLAGLGWTHVPVQVRRSWPPLIDKRDSASWPLVADGSIDRSFAEQMLSKYAAA